MSRRSSGLPPRVMIPPSAAAPSRHFVVCLLRRLSLLAWCRLSGLPGLHRRRRHVRDRLFRLSAHGGGAVNSVPYLMSFSFTAGPPAQHMLQHHEHRYHMPVCVVAGPPAEHT